MMAVMIYEKEGNDGSDEIRERGKWNLAVCSVEVLNEARVDPKC
jgi:hypothetical protein